MKDEMHAVAAENIDVPAYLLRESHHLPIRRTDNWLTSKPAHGPGSHGGGIDRLIEIANCLHVAEHALAVQRVHYFYRIPQHHQNFSQGVEVLYLRGSRRRCEAASA